MFDVIIKGGKIIDGTGGGTLMLPTLESAVNALKPSVTLQTQRRKW